MQNVSVVMCTYNGALFVEEQTRSILQQTYPMLELLIFDDASTDNTFEILTALATENPVIKLHRNEKNIGFSKNFEQALKAANGDVIAISDQDDIWMKTKIEEMLKAWTTTSPLIYCESKLFYDSVPENPVPHPKWRRFEGTDPRKIFLANSVSGHNTIIRKELLKLVLPFENNIMYDWWMAVVAASNGGVEYYPKVLVLQRGHESNITIDKKGMGGNEKEKWVSYKPYLSRHLRKFATAVNLQKECKMFAVRFADLLEQPRHSFSLSLFLFFIKNRLLLFNFKRRKVAIFSHIKHSYRRSRNDN